MKIVIASNNPAKIKIFGLAFQELGLTVLEAEKKPVAETGVTPEENAILKAQAAWVPGRIVFADDAGLEIDALGGEPGVQTRRWSGRFSDYVSDHEWLKYLLERMQGIPLEGRTAAFVSGWAVIDAQGRSETRRLLTPFVIAEAPVRVMEPGFPLSAVAIRSEETDLVQRVTKHLRDWPFIQEILAQSAASGQTRG